MTSILRLVFVLLLLSAVSSGAQETVPEVLQDWQQWVLKDREYRGCPHYFDRNAAEKGDFVCAWPGILELAVTSTGADFEQSWTVFAGTHWVALPGSADYWPEAVTINGRPGEVIARNNVPSVRLAPGSYRAAGRIQWDSRPGLLRLPPESGLVALVVDGRRVERPEMNRDGVFLGERKRETNVVDSVSVQVHRLVSDSVPTRLVTRLNIDVSGNVREELFGPVLPDGFVPLSIQSQLPAKLEADGNLRLQVRPGRWTIFLSARGPGVVDSIATRQTRSNWPAAEIWSYQSNSRLRVTAAEGLPPVDPKQVQVPGNWEDFPAFRVDPGATFAVTQRSRGIVSAANELVLNRTIWLDFDGSGIIVEDAIGGEMRTGWRLDMQPPFALLRATERDENLLITAGRREGLTGVEVRQTAVDLGAIARSDTLGRMPVTGWDARFADVEMTLNLPPGNKLLAAPGVDTARGSWASQWQLLDFFLVLITTIAAWRLLGRGVGIVALLALVLSYHEMHAPGWLWLNLLVAIALMRVAPAGRLRQIVSSYQLLSAVALLMALIPFLASQMRIAIYPQLEPQTNQYQLYDYGVAPAGLAPAEEAVRTVKREAELMRPKTLDEESRSLEQVVVTGSRPSVDFARYAPNAIVQAGPGIPAWQWNTYRLDWSGPVDAGQTLRLVVLPRWVVSLLRVTAVVFLLLFAAALAADILKKRWSLPGGLTLGRAASPGLLAVALITAAMTVSPVAEAQIPDAELLEQLQRRLLEPPDCVPRCAETVAAEIAVSREAVNMVLTIHAMADVAIVLPGSADGWRPDAVMLNGAARTNVIRDRDALWIYVTAGQHTVTLRGPVPDVDSLEVPFPTPPRVITVTSEGWQVAGIKDRRLLAGSLQLTRLRPAAGGIEPRRWESSRFPVFARVERTIELDLDWRVRTTVFRVAPEEGALTLDIPLIEGEKIVSGNFSVNENRVLVSMSPQQQSLSWTSSLPRRSPLTLVSENDASWSEVWRFAVGNIWNAEFDGLPESEVGNEAGNVRVAEFDPRAGERLTLVASRPEAAAGSTLAFDSVRLSVSYGNRSSDSSLVLNYRSTRGAQHMVRLPDGAEMTSVAIDGRPLSLLADAGQLTLPILPGEHSIQIEWRQGGGMGVLTTTPDVEIGVPSGNIEISLAKPRDRWLLGTAGPKLGPAVLYWSELAVLIVFSLILGRTGLAPLNSMQWLLLSIGFSTFSWTALAVFVAWLLACGAREKWQPDVHWWQFNLIQIVVGGLTAIALLFVITSLPEGLLGTPDMHVTGNGSDGDVLRWFADRSDSALPVAAAVTLPLWIYKALILAWALWLSFALLRWLPWAWRCFSSQGYWRSRSSRAAGTDSEAG